MSARALDAPVREAGGGEGLGDVFGDVVRDGLAGQRVPVAGSAGPGRMGRVSVCGPKAGA